MSNGPSHYRRAEDLLDLAIRQWESDSPIWQLTMQRAQVEAGLAVAAATIDAVAVMDGQVEHQLDWNRAFATEVQPS